MSLYPTPTRLALLAAVGRGEINRYGNGLDYDADGRKVRAAMEELRRAGWVVLGEPHPVKRRWELTEGGRSVLDGA